MANLHVRDVLQPVVGKHVAPALEEHHSNRPAGEHVSDDQLSNNVETGLLVGDGLDDAYNFARLGKS